MGSRIPATTACFLHDHTILSESNSYGCPARQCQSALSICQSDNFGWGSDTQKRSFLVLKEGGHLVSAVQPVSQEEAAKHRVSGEMMRLAPSGDVLGRIGRLLEEGTIRPDVATVYALQDVAQAWKDIAGNLPGVHGMSPSGPGTARRRSHGKIVLRVA